jgi:3-phosphoglycerate kinase
MRKLTVRDLPVAGKRVLTRVDFNVPLDKEGHVADATESISRSRPVDTIEKGEGDIDATSGSA